MSLKIDRLQLEIIINNDQARTSLRNLNDEALGIQKSMKNMVKGTDEWIQATKRLSSIKEQMDTIYDSIGIAGLSLSELRKKQQEFNMVLNQLPANSPEYAKYKQTLDEINTRIKEVKGNAQGAHGMLETMLGVAGGVGLFEIAKEGFNKVKGALTDYVTEGIKSAVKLRDSEKLLLAELNGQKDVQQDLIDLAKQKAGTTFFTRLEVEEAEKFLAIQERTPEQIKKTIQAATNLATLTGGSLQDAVEQLDGTMEGKLSKGLGKLSKDFKDLTKEQLYNGSAIDLIQKKYSGLAEKDMNTMDGMINLLGKSWRALQRTIGEIALGSGGMFSGLITDATSILDTFKKWIEVPVSKKLEEEQSRVNYLAASITDANLTAEARNKLYKELETLAPSVTAGLDAENLSYQNLTSNLAAYNDQMVNNIIIQKETEKVENANADLAKARMVRVAMENVMRKNMTDYLTSLKLKAKGENAKDAAETLAQGKEIADVLYNTNLNFKQKMEALDKKYKGPKNESYQIALDAENAAQEKVNLQLQAKKQLISDLGITIAQVTAKSTENANKESKEIIKFSKLSVEELNKIISDGAVQAASQIEKTNARLAQKELKRRDEVAKGMEKYQDLMREISEMEKTNFADKLSQTQREIQGINDKYNAEIRKIEEFKQHNKKELSPKQNKQLDDDIGKLEIARDAQTKQVLEQAELDFAEKIKQIHEALRVGRMTITDREVYEINKKYDDLQKEILDAIQYRYDQEVKQAHGNADLIAQAEKNKAAALDRIDADMSALKKARQDELNKAKKDGDLKFEEELRNLRLKGEADLAKGKEKIQDEVNAKYRKLLDENVGDEAKTAEIKAQMAQEFNAKIEQYQTEHLQKMLQKYSQYASTIVSALSGLEQAFSAKENAEVKKAEDSNTKKKASLKAQLDAGKINQKQYDDQVAQMDSELDKKKAKLAHDQAVRQKALSIVQAIINTAQAITSALTAGPIIGEALAIVVGILGAAQIALIASTDVPEAAEGRYDVIGQKSGKKFSKVPYAGDAKTGIYGKPTLINETGDEIIVDPFTTRNLIMNYPEIVNGIKLAASGYVPERASGQYSSLPVNSPAMMNPAIAAEYLQAMRDHTHALLNPSPVPTYTIWSETELLNKKLASIEKDVSKSAA